MTKGAGGGGTRAHREGPVPPRAQRSGAGAAFFRSPSERARERERASAPGQARARGANCDSNPLPRGAAEPRAWSRRRALPLALARALAGSLGTGSLGCPVRPGARLASWLAIWHVRAGQGVLVFSPGHRRRPLERERKERDRASERRPKQGRRRGEARAGRGGPGAPCRAVPCRGAPRGAAQSGEPGREGGKGRREGWVGGGRVGGERESNSGTRPERPAR